jgi:type IV pilus biogenesis protein PilP
MADKDQGSDNKSRQKIMIGVTVVVVAFVGWQVMGMFGGKAQEEEQAKVAAATPPPAPMPTPKAAELPKQPAPLTQREVELMQLQQETEAKYPAAINELQMLKIQRDIAETNKAIVSAKLDTVSAQKNIVAILAPEQPTNYSQRLTNPVTGEPTGAGVPTQDILQVAYTVISVSEIQSRWSAVLGAQGKLYNIHVGDILPPDNSKVISIDRYGVVLEKEGVKKTISLVPII